ncbi:MAG: hypothetical protein CME06_13845 [Gemmatimonadetes bacterium]|nr:hypothetical protein [Gemmatimonadota bacterium]
MLYLIAFIVSSLTAGLVGYAIAVWLQAEQVEELDHLDELEAQVEVARKVFATLGTLLARSQESVECQSQRLGALRRDLSERDGDDPADVVRILEAEIDRIIADNLKLSADLRDARRTVARQEEALSSMKEDARTDSLTRIANRREFDLRLASQHDRFEKLGEGYSILMIDIDRFKQVNDEKGHQAGDHVIAGVAQLAEFCTNPVDLVARYGGEEFAVLLPRTMLGGARLMAEKIREKVEHTSFWFQDQPLQITISLGAGQIVAEEKPEALLRRVDDALYDAKRRGRNRVRVAEPGERTVEVRIREIADGSDAAAATPERD